MKWKRSFKPQKPDLPCLVGWSEVELEGYKEIIHECFPVDKLQLITDELRKAPTQELKVTLSVVNSGPILNHEAIRTKLLESFDILQQLSESSPLTGLVLSVDSIIDVEE